MEIVIGVFGKDLWEFAGGNNHIALVDTRANAEALKNWKTVR